MSKAKRLVVEQQDIVITGRAGDMLIGAIAELSDLRKRLNDVQLDERPRPAISHSDVIVSLIALCAEGELCFDHLERKREDAFFQKALGLSVVPSSATARQRCEQGATKFEPIVADEALHIVEKACARLTPVSTPSGPMVPVDIDLMLQDNSGTKKEGVERTYRQFDGFGVNAAYAGREGYMIHQRLQPGNHHANWKQESFLRKSIDNARRLAGGQRLLVRMDSGNDSVANVAICREEGVSWLIKRNFRKLDTAPLIDQVREHGRQIRDDERCAVWVWSEWRETGDGCRERFVYRVTEKKCDPETGQSWITPLEEIEGWRTDLEGEEEAILSLYEDHGTSEQFHSEYKTDLDMERLPSQTFAVNRLALAIAALSFNALRLIGQKSLEHEATRPSEQRKRRVSRRRLRTVIYDFMHMGARLTHHARRWKLVLSKHTWQASIWMKLYAWLWQLVETPEQQAVA